jgi:hypothetical protein
MAGAGHGGSHLSILDLGTEAKGCQVRGQPVRLHSETPSQNKKVVGNCRELESISVMSEHLLGLLSKVLSALFPEAFVE